MSTFADKINSPKPTLVDFHAVWCGPCKMLEPTIKAVHQKLGEKITFLKVDIDRNPQAANAFQIRGVPTLILFRNGEIKWRQSGVLSAAALEEKLRQYI
ncbi:MAG TPA: thioredoxin [Saprospiraceae bacterium]|nr:thioredoxin [Saprospiraceae bacterium]